VAEGSFNPQTAAFNSSVLCFRFEPTDPQKTIFSIFPFVIFSFFLPFPFPVRFGDVQQKAPRIQLELIANPNLCWAGPLLDFELHAKSLELKIKPA